MLPIEFSTTMKITEVLDWNPEIDSYKIRVIFAQDYDASYYALTDLTTDFNLYIKMQDDATGVLHTMRHAITRVTEDYNTQGIVVELIYADMPNYKIIPVNISAYDTAILCRRLENGLITYPVIGVDTEDVVKILTKENILNALNQLYIARNTWTVPEEVVYSFDLTEAPCHSGELVTVNGVLLSAEIGEYSICSSTLAINSTIYRLVAGDSVSIVYKSIARTKMLEA